MMIMTKDDDYDDFSPMDLQRVAAEKAAAVLVLCNKFSSDPCMSCQFIIIIIITIIIIIIIIR